MAFSPLARRRWQAFRAHRRGWWSLWIFLALFTLTRAGLAAYELRLTSESDVPLHLWPVAFAKGVEQLAG